MLETATEKQVTSQRHGHILTNSGVWSPDGQWIVYDVRSDPAGSIFDGTRIERIHIETGKVQLLYESTNGAGVGVATCSPMDERVVFIHGPENPTPGWGYSFCNRRGVIVDAAKPGVAVNLDARDLTPPFTRGALRGGTHLHTFSGDGRWVCFTYEDMLLAQFATPGDDHDINQRNVGACVFGHPVHVTGNHPGNYGGTHFSVLATRTTAKPAAGSDEILKAAEESWVGTSGYLRPDGSRQVRAVAFQGHVVSPRGEPMVEAFIVDLPDDVTVPEEGPSTGTPARRPLPPKGAVQRRLTFTADRKHPGLQGPRHWLRSSPDGSRIAFLMKDDRGVDQLWTISPNGGDMRQLTHNPWSISSAFTWGPDGQWIAHAMDGSIFVTDSSTGESFRLTRVWSSDVEAPRPEACVFSPDGAKIAYVRTIATAAGTHNQIFVVNVPAAG